MEHTQGGRLYNEASLGIHLDKNAEVITPQEMLSQFKKVNICGE